MCPWAPVRQRIPDYEDILSAEAYIDTGNYSSIKQAVVELFLRNPTGNGRIYAKLYNVTDKHDVWFSEVFTEGRTGGKKRSDGNARSREQAV